MSTKASISHSNRHHFYEECLDNSNVYLEVNKPPGVELSHRDFSGTTATLIIPIEIWRQVVEDWIESHWGKHPDRDNKEIELNVSNFEDLLDEVIKKKNKHIGSSLDDLMEEKDEKKQSFTSEE